MTPLAIPGHEKDHSQNQKGTTGKSSQFEHFPRALWAYSDCAPHRRMGAAELERHRSLPALGPFLWPAAISVLPTGRASE
jgi:hypothetical protein